MIRKSLPVTLSITVLMMTFWIGAASATRQDRSAPAVPQAMLSKGEDSEVSKGAALTDAGQAGQVLLYEPARAANIRTMLDNAADVGTFTSITIGADGLPLISYRDVTNNRLKVAHCDTIACTSATVTVSSSPAQHTSITIGSDGLGVISLYDPVNDDLRVGHCVDVECSSVPVSSVDLAGDVGQFNSIDIGADGFPIISYYDATNGNVKFADCDSLNCNTVTIRTLDTTGNVGQYTSMIRGALGSPIISYLDVTNSKLKVLACGDTECATVAHRTIVDNEIGAGLQTSIALGADDKPIISYVEIDTSSRLKIAHCSDVTCTSLDFKGYFNAIGMGITSSIAIGLDGIPMISHFDQDNNTLNIVRCKNIDCSEGNYNITLDVGNAGSNTSLTIGVDGLPIISYYDLGNGALKTLHCGSPRCKDFQRRR